MAGTLTADDWASARRRLSTSDDGTAGREERP